MKTHIILAILLLPLISFCQSTFIINSIPDYTPEDDIIHLAGDVTGWQPADPNFILTKVENDNWAITLSYSFGTNIQFKFTRGSWETVEKGANGEEIQNRTYTFPDGIDTVYLEVLNWADEGGGGGGGGSTASNNVHIFDEQFYMPQLDKNRRVWIYLPPDYETSDKSYPVLYMHDGQNLFDNQTSYAGEWEVDEALNELAEQGMNVPIVVGIDNGGADRINEYSPWVTSYGGGDGEAYIEFLVNTLKPAIDENYRTLTGRENTGIMGSSMGGFISHYAALQYPLTFSKSGIFSPAYWISDSIWEFTTSSGKQYPGKFYLLVGGEEGDHYISQLWAMKDTLTSIGFGGDEVKARETPGAQHNEYFWRNEFAEAYTWLFNEYANSIEEFGVETINLTPNPVNDIINLHGIVKKYDSLEIVNINGKTVLSYTTFNGLIIDVRNVTSGTNILIIKSDNKKVFVKFIKL